MTLATPRSPEPRRPRTRGRLLTFGLVAVFLGLAALEAGARLIEVWVPPHPVDYGMGFQADSHLFVPSSDDPTQMVTSGSKQASFRMQRFSRVKAPGTLRIAALGGSSVLFLDAEFDLLTERLPARTKRFDRVEIINAGGLSYGTHRLVPILVELLEYDLDLILIYSGHNEFEEAEQLSLVEDSTVALPEALSRFALYRVLRDRVIDLRIERHRQENLRIEKTAITRARPQYTPEQIEHRIALYERRLAQMVRLARASDVGVIIGTVGSNLLKPSLGEHDHDELERLYLAKEYAQWADATRAAVVRSSLRGQASDLENGIIRRLAASEDVPLVDIEAAVIAHEPNGIPGATLFEDHCHLNAKGRAIWRESYEAAIVEWLARE